jgi:hypothetical protein
MFILKCDLCNKRQNNTDPVWHTHTRSPFMVVYDLCPECRDTFETEAQLDSEIDSKNIYGRRNVSREAYMEIYWSKVLCSGQNVMSIPRWTQLSTHMWEFHWEHVCLE